MIKHSDDRVKCTNEILQAIRVVKLYAWEAPMEARVMNSRSKEMSFLARYLDYNSLLREIMFSAGPIATAVIFATSVYGLNNSLKVVQIFRVLAFLNILRFPQNLLAQVIHVSLFFSYIPYILLILCCHHEITLLIP